MLTISTIPSTVNGIKRLAKQFKKSSNIPHHEALDLAAKEAGFANYSHACRQLQNLSGSGQSHHLFLTSYWFDRESRQAGRELIEFTFSKPLSELISASEINCSSGLARFRVASTDYLVDDWISPSQSDSRERICKAIRVLQFIEYSGLKPINFTTAAFPKNNPNNRIPNSDHSSYWRDQATGQIVYIDEPYLASVDDGERAAWAGRYNWHLHASKWAGMYFPGMTGMFLATEASRGDDFAELMSKVDSIPAPITVDQWIGISSKGHEPFLSPGCVTKQDKKRAIPKGTILREAGLKTLPMQRWNCPQNERRPNSVMSVDNHQLVARIINALEYSAAKPFRVNNRLSAIKSVLENWFFAEHEKEVTDKYDLFYYGGVERNDPLVLKSNTTQGVVCLLNDLKALLLNAYIDCAPLKKIISKIDTSIKITSQSR